MSSKFGLQSSAYERSSGRSDSMSLPALAGLVGGFFPAYLIGEALLANSIHPLHWVVAIAGASVGYLTGVLYTLVKATLRQTVSSRE